MGSTPGIPVAFSKGFNPTPNISFGLAVATGIASTWDLVHIELQHDESLEGAAARLQGQLPEGMDIRMAWRPRIKASQLGRAVSRVLFQVERLPLSRRALEERVASLQHRDVRIQKRNKKGQVQEISILEHIAHIRVLGEGKVLVGLKMHEGSGLRIQDLLEAAFTLPRDVVLASDVARRGLLYQGLDPTQTDVGVHLPPTISRKSEGQAA
ncbi:MAG: hypothetical protein COX57_05255 [Alphaproteobacteria bacterium CG_4_10_14_0_2_um_filter_63_37]|nr:MAG: hypothetical protein COX57_05255 [Alphaproteobacteria bacterium CG_4_10_14_0_2_um_filter_63_37]